MPKLTEAQQEERRARILDAAEVCFARHGFHRTTMQDICREAGVSAGALYVYFNSKEALIEGFSARERAQVLAAFATAGDTPDFAQSLIHLMHECILAKPRHKSILWLELGAEATRNDSIAATQQSCEQQIRAALTEVLAKAEREGRIAPVVPLAQVVNALEVIAEGMFFRRAVKPDFDSASAAEAALVMVAALVRPTTVQNQTAPAARAVSETV